jgi:hypothetical protein
MPPLSASDHTKKKPASSAKIPFQKGNYLTALASDLLGCLLLCRGGSLGAGLLALSSGSLGPGLGLCNSGVDELTTLGAVGSGGGTSGGLGGLLGLLDLGLVGTDVATGDLYDTPGPLLDAGLSVELLVHTPAGKSPVELGGLLPLVVQALDLAVDKDDELTGPGDKSDAMARVDLGLGEGADVSLDDHFDRLEPAEGAKKGEREEEVEIARHKGFVVVAEERTKRGN